jgi:hypothetical protein
MILPVVGCFLLAWIIVYVVPLLVSLLFWLAVGGAVTAGTVLTVGTVLALRERARSRQERLIYQEALLVAPSDRVFVHSVRPDRITS